MKKRLFSLAVAAAMILGMLPVMGTLADNADTAGEVDAVFTADIGSITANAYLTLLEAVTGLTVDGDNEDIYFAFAAEIKGAIDDAAKAIDDDGGDPYDGWAEYVLASGAEDGLDPYASVDDVVEAIQGVIGMIDLSVAAFALVDDVYEADETTIVAALAAFDAFLGEESNYDDENDEFYEIAAEHGFFAPALLDAAVEAATLTTDGPVNIETWEDFIAAFNAGEIEESPTEWLFVLAEAALGIIDAAIEAANIALGDIFTILENIVTELDGDGSGLYAALEAYNAFTTPFFYADSDGLLLVNWDVMVAKYKVALEHIDNVYLAKFGGDTATIADILEAILEVNSAILGENYELITETLGGVKSAVDAVDADGMIVALEAFAAFFGEDLDSWVVLEALYAEELKKSTTYTDWASFITAIGSGDYSAVSFEAVVGDVVDAVEVVNALLIGYLEDVAEAVSADLEDVDEGDLIDALEALEGFVAEEGDWSIDEDFELEYAAELADSANDWADFVAAGLVGPYTDINLDDVVADIALAIEVVNNGTAPTASFEDDAVELTMEFDLFDPADVLIFIDLGRGTLGAVGIDEVWVADTDDNSGVHSDELDIGDDFTYSAGVLTIFGSTIEEAIDEFGLEATDNLYIVILFDDDADTRAVLTLAIEDNAPQGNRPTVTLVGSEFDLYAPAPVVVTYTHGTGYFETTAVEGVALSSDNGSTWYTLASVEADYSVNTTAREITIISGVFEDGYAKDDKVLIRVTFDEGDPVVTSSPLTITDTTPSVAPSANFGMDGVTPITKVTFDIDDAAADDVVINVDRGSGALAATTYKVFWSSKDDKTAPFASAADLVSLAADQTASTYSVVASEIKDEVTEYGLLDVGVGKPLYIYIVFNDTSETVKILTINIVDGSDPVAPIFEPTGQDFAPSNFTAGSGTAEMETDAIGGLTNTLKIVGNGADNWRWGARVSFANLGIEYPGKYTIEVDYYLPAGNLPGTDAATAIQVAFQDDGQVPTGLEVITGSTWIGTVATDAWTTISLTIELDDTFDFSGRTLRVQPGNGVFEHAWYFASFAVEEILPTDEEKALAFEAKHATILAKTLATITWNDLFVVSGDSLVDLLVDEYENDLAQEVINELTAGVEDKIIAFADLKEDIDDFLNDVLDGIDFSDWGDVQDTLSAYYDLSEVAQELLESELDVETDLVDAAVAIFRDDHDDALELVVEELAIATLTADTALVNAALADVRTTGKWASFDKVLTALADDIARLEALEDELEILGFVDAFLADTNIVAIMDLTTGTIALSDLGKLPAALVVYDMLSPALKARPEVVAVKDHHDDLLAKWSALNFEDTYSDVLLLNPLDDNYSEANDILRARVDFNGLSAEAKDYLSAGTEDKLNALYDAIIGDVWPDLIVEVYDYTAGDTEGLLIALGYATDSYSNLFFDVRDFYIAALQDFKDAIDAVADSLGADDWDDYVTNGTPARADFELFVAAIKGVIDGVNLAAVNAWIGEIGSTDNAGVLWVRLNLIGEVAAAGLDNLDVGNMEAYFLLIVTEDMFNITDIGTLQDAIDAVNDAVDEMVDFLLDYADELTLVVTNPSSRLSDAEVQALVDDFTYVPEALTEFGWLSDGAKALLALEGVTAVTIAATRDSLIAALEENVKLWISWANTSGLKDSAPPIASLNDYLLILASINIAIDAYESVSRELAEDLDDFSDLEDVIDNIGYTKAAKDWQDAHATILAKTVANIEISDKAAVTVAQTAFNLLHTSSKGLLEAEEELLDDLATEIAAKEAAGGNTGDEGGDIFIPPTTPTDPEEPTEPDGEPEVGDLTIGAEEVAEILEEIAEAIENGDDDFTLTFELEGDIEATFTLDLEALETIFGEGVTVEFVVEAVDVETLDDDVAELVEDRPVYDFSVLVNGVAVTEFGGGTISIAIPYELGDGEDAEAIVVYYLNADGELDVIRGYYDDGFVYFVTNHFSKFVIGYNPVTFTDTIPTWASGHAVFAGARGIFVGDQAGRFNSEAPITYQTLAAVLSNYLGLGAELVWADGDHITWGEEFGIFAGLDIEDYTEAVTRADMAVIIYNFIVKSGVKVSVKAGAEFDDIDGLDAAVVDAIEFLAGHGIVSGTGGASFSPDMTIDRGQIAAIMSNIVKAFGK
ncbi:MAG: S-layer homology domain-containing protein [Oscillospiraceae bacterium]|nr:S-layer homology domain-containing protein [Oscillospiraceae bacterium]